MIRAGKLDADSVLGVPQVHAEGLQGLMDVVLHPRFDENHWVYLTYHEALPPGQGAVTLARGTWNGRSLADVRDIFHSNAMDTEASRVAFGPDGMLYMSISAPGGRKDGHRAQDPSDYAGKIVRLRDDGTIPDDDPFVPKAGYKPAIFTLGHRNGHALALNPETGDIWQTEQGLNGGDELNVLKSGRNYGWPIVSYGKRYSGAAVSPEPVRKGMEPPTMFVLYRGSLSSVEAQRVRHGRP